ncbi:MAG: hypothetical protein ACTSQ8_13495, partial [Candidatus Helarchaeota archaeon]
TPRYRAAAEMGKNGGIAFQYPSLDLRGRVRKRVLGCSKGLYMDKFGQFFMLLLILQYWIKAELIFHDPNSFSGNTRDQVSYYSGGYGAL